MRNKNGNIRSTLLGASGLALALGACATPATETEPGVTGAPAPPAGVEKPAPDEEGAAKVYYGTAAPTHVPLTPGQVMAVGTFHHCSGLLITPTWVLSASHCNLRRGHEFCVGREPGNPDRCVDVVRGIDNPRADMALAELRRDLREVAPEVEPVPLVVGRLDDGWLGQTAEASGYGRNERGGYGRRAFTAQPIVSLGNRMLTIDGEGRRGVCFGDSGGPVMVAMADGSARVAGNLSGGDSSCVGRDNYTRVDVYRDWIEGYTGPTVPPGPQPCGAVDAAGAEINRNRRRGDPSWKPRNTA